ncbi:MAG TPA: hypothetical protein VJC05_03175 [Candidatus Andersenbacteria bacterium]|nr:hypothetical protein [Candidatus Andersenbacteria bacterium]
MAAPPTWFRVLYSILGFAAAAGLAWAWLIPLFLLVEGSDENLFFVLLAASMLFWPFVSSIVLWKITAVEDGTRRGYRLSIFMYVLAVGFAGAGRQWIRFLFGPTPLFDTILLLVIIIGGLMLFRRGQRLRTFA